MIALAVGCATPCAWYRLTAASKMAWRVFSDLCGVSAVLENAMLKQYKKNYLKTIDKWNN